MYNEFVYLSIPRLSLCVALENSIMMRQPSLGKTDAESLQLFRPDYISKRTRVGEK